ncbi:hypothetical protein L596_006950 [Steinernema carpocapsae]|uniref:Uncharacterized protein n=1 Tax=Steinernema carpocapsae TaxID=34508 RepID=A0A4U5P7L6_STECR|nr:hypothetical protein L596_006950 [Steinernema carpocapsae]
MLPFRFFLRVFTVPSNNLPDVLAFEASLRKDKLRITFYALSAPLEQFLANIFQLICHLHPNGHQFLQLDLQSSSDSCSFYLFLS